VDTLADPAIRLLRVAWDEGQDDSGVPLVRLVGEWDYLAWDDGVRGYAILGAETTPRAALTENLY